MTQFRVHHVCQTPASTRHLPPQHPLASVMTTFALQIKNLRHKRVTEFPKAHSEKMMGIENIEEAELVPGAPHPNPGYSQ